MQCIRPPSPNPIRKGGREGGHATAKSGGGSLCVCRVISRSVVKELSGDPLQFLPRMHGASAAEGGEGNEYLEKFMAIRKDDLGLTPRAVRHRMMSDPKKRFFRMPFLEYWILVPQNSCAPLQGINSSPFRRTVRILSTFRSAPKVLLWHNPLALESTT